MNLVLNGSKKVSGARIGLEAHKGTVMLFKDVPTKHRVIRNGRRHKVFERIDWMGNHVRFVTHRSRAEQERIRRDVYRNAAVVGILSWSQVEPWEIGL
jgi:hypothetical protein